MERMGHSNSRAALIYQHASRDHDQAIAAALEESLTAAKQQAERPPSGTQRACNGHADAQRLPDLGCSQGRQGC